MNTTLAFSKGHGTGNDFLLFADPEGHREFSAAQISALCDRNFGIGADGLIRAVKSAHCSEGAASLAEDPAAEWFMDYYNSDGSVAEMCGNGIRVFAHYLVQKGLAQLPDGHTLTIGTRAGVRDLQRNLAGFQVDLGRWRFFGDDIVVRAKNLDVARPALGVSMGNPHCVVVLANSAELSAVDLSQPPHISPEVTEGANVEFVVADEPLVRNGIGHFRMRVHERGSGETLSCGTGAAAAALAIRQWAGAGAPHQWRVEVAGGTLGVRMFPTEEGEHVALSGPAEIVYEGTIALS